MQLCAHCGVPLAGPGFILKDRRIVCQACGPKLSSRLCEECGYYYSIGGGWLDERVCQPCMVRIRKEIGEPPLDADLTIEEREYLAQTFGLESYEDAQLAQDAPYCRSCIEHGPNRDDYPCLQKLCQWEMDRRDQYNRQFLTTFTTTSTNATTNAWRITGNTYSNTSYRYYQ
jgi:hypothetical protein